MINGDFQKFLINNTEAGSIAKELDAQDGSVDGRISASVWNEYIDKWGGGHVKENISIKDATNIITKYMVDAIEINKAKTKELIDFVKKFLGVSKITDADLAKFKEMTQLDPNTAKVINFIMEKLGNNKQNLQESENKPSVD